ncbi:hypothetical protein SALBM311S_02261 [Streptomyces alboniger]
MAANAIIVTEAGAFTGLDGRPGPHSGNARLHGLLHDEFLGAQRALLTTHAAFGRRRQG